jgi:hypothetical protein
MFHVRVHSRAWPPNSARPACGDTYAPVVFAVFIRARNADASLLATNVFDACSRRAAAA